MLSGDRLMTAWTPSRPLRLLNLMPSRISHLVRVSVPRFPSDEGHLPIVVP